MSASATIFSVPRVMPSPAANKSFADRQVADAGHGIEKLLIATLNRSEGETGIHAHTRSLVSGMREANVQCEMVSPFTGSVAWLAVFAVRTLLLNRLNKTWSTQWHRYWHRRALERNLRARLCRHQPNAIIAQCPVSALAALNVRRELDIAVPIVAVCHFNYSEASEYRDKGELRGEAAFQAVIELETDVLRRVDQVIFVSNCAQAMVEEDRGIVPKSSAVIWNGISGDMATGAIQRSALRAKLGLSERDVVLINVGTLEPRKNQLALLDQFARIATEHPAAKLLLVGDGPDRQSIVQKITAMELGERVKCLGFRSDVPALLAIADLCIHYARLENCPVVLLEAARVGLPAAAVPAGGAAEILGALGAGVLLDPDDLDKSARTLAPLLTDPALRREMGERARAGFFERFTQQAMVREYLAALQSIGAAVTGRELG